MPLAIHDLVLVAATDQDVATKWTNELARLKLRADVVEDAQQLSLAARSSHLLLHCQSFPDDPVEAVAGLREDGYEGEVVAVTSSPSISEAVAFIGLGCYDYVPASLSADRVVRQMAEALGLTTPSRPQYELLWRSFRKRSDYDHVYSASGSCRRTYTQAAQAAPSDVTCLIEGETGTGKEYLARALHFMSPRRDKPFVAVNCGAIPESLLESELFGHERGAFTSATRAKPGLCETAHKGTLFLDEIGDMSMPMQVKMLRFLQDKSFVRVGGLETVKVDVRVIAATNQDLRRAVREGRFREDLYYRLAVMNLNLPPLRDREDDVLVFARHFLNKHTPGSGPKTLCECAEARLRDHHWPGNLRELENVIQRAILMSPSRNIHAEHLSVDEVQQDAPLRLFPVPAITGVGV
ncbi:MAG: sigma-54 dependent transcriptional regulator [Armatimonadia bacterium]